MEYEQEPTRRVTHKHDYTIISAAVIEAASMPSSETSHRRMLMSVREATDYEFAAIAAVMLDLIEHGILERAINIRRRGSALTPLGMEVHEQLRRLAD